jgi:hypothetical protein
MIQSYNASTETERLELLSEWRRTGGARDVLRLECRECGARAEYFAYRLHGWFENRRREYKDPALMCPNVVCARRLAIAADGVLDQVLQDRRDAQRGRDPIHRQV